jgi:hypothetical protein
MKEGEGKEGMAVLTVVGMHARTEGIEDARHPDINVPLERTKEKMESQKKQGT